jgi:hypothetical protein
MIRYSLCGNVLHPRKLESSACTNIIALQLSERYFSYTHTVFEANILVTQFVYQVFQSAFFFVVMELGDEMTAVAFRRELLIGKGGEFMFQVVLLVNMCIACVYAM